MEIFQSEREIRDLIVGNDKIAIISEAQLVEPNGLVLAKENTDTPVSEELYYTKSILVTTNWNKNDDVFLPEEVWAARKTVVDKPTNLDHNQDKIVGHITSQWIINGEGEVVDDEEDDNMPDFFHVCNGAVIYKYLPKRNENMSSEVEELISQIEAGEKFVSMECLFRGFDYALISESGTSFDIVERKADTAFLSKHLRAYGGTGEYGDKKIGRVVRKISFSGKGYVDKPANPESIILSFANLSTDFEKSGVYNTRTISNEEENSNMSLDVIQKELDETKAKLDKAISANEDLQAQLAKSNVEKYETEIAELKSENETLKSEAAVSVEKIENLNSLKAEHEKAIELLTQEKQELEASIAEMKKESLVAKRIDVLVQAGVDRDVAVAKVEKFISLSDEQFEDISSTVIELVKAKATQSSEGEETEEADAGTVTDEVLDEVETESESASAGAIDDVDTSEDEHKARLSALEQTVASLIVPKKRGNG